MCFCSTLYFKLCCSAYTSPGFSIIKELTVEVEPPVVPKSQPTVEDVKVSTNGASTEKEDNKFAKSTAAAAVEQAVEPEAIPSNSKLESTKSPPVSPVKNRDDGSTDELDTKQSGPNDVLPRATESVRYIFCFFFSFYMKYAYLLLEKKTLQLFANTSILNTTISSLPIFLVLTTLNHVVFNQYLLSFYCTGIFYSNRGMDSSAHGDKTYDGHSWAPSFDHGTDNDSLWNFGHKVRFHSHFLTSYHVVDILHYLVLTSTICFSGW
jgi:hypothetical protein